MARAGRGDDDTATEALARNIDLQVAVHNGRVDRIDDALHVRLLLRPLLSTKKDDRNFPTRNILPIAQILVGGQQDVEAGALRGGQ